MRRSDRIQTFVEAIWDWYSVHKRSLPWRDLPDADPAVRAYKVMVSEIMLQQTQVSRVKIVFKDFIELFPHIHSLACASNRDVLLAWRGMGYNSRALRLRDAAKIIQNFPQSMAELLQIPGIGPYTAAAIRNFAFNIPTPCIDTNIRRILHRTFVGPETADGTWEKDDRYLLNLAAEVLDIAMKNGRNSELQVASCKAVNGNLQPATCNFSCSASDWHAALMDFGSLVQTKRNPRWDLCPLTAKGIMKTTPKSFIKMQTCNLQPATRKLLTEPGRFIGSRYIPNRIFRGKVIEELRDAPQGLPLETIGKRICLDWSPREHRKWLKDILRKLETDRMLTEKSGTYALAD